MTTVYDLPSATGHLVKQSDFAGVPMGNAPPPPPPQPQVIYQPGATTSGKATASLVCGIIGILIFGIILGPLAIGLGVSAKNDIKNRPGELTGTGQADAGITCGAVAIVIWLVLLAMYVA